MKKKRLLAAIATVMLLGSVLVGSAEATPAHWTTTPNPFGTFIPGLPGGPGLQFGGGVLNSVSCPSRQFCVAVGASQGAPSMTLLWNGKRWYQFPNSGIQLTALTGISCTSRHFCMAVGNVTDTQSGNLSPIAEQWDGHAWSLSTPENTTAANTRLNGISCSAFNQCNAVGETLDSTQTHTSTVAERWDGATWTLETTFGPAGTSTFNSVSCPTLKFCMAAGSNDAGPRVDGSGERVDGYYAITLNGGLNWTQGGFPPGDPFESVSCTELKFCMVSGIGGIFEWQGLQGPFLPLHNLPGVGRLGFSTDFPTVTCVSPRSCVGVARQSGPTPSGLLSLVIRWDGQSWTQVAAAAGAFLGSDCADHHYCFVVGAPVFLSGPGPLMMLGTT